MKKLVLTTLEEYRAASARVEAMGKIAPGSPEQEEWEILMDALDRWEETHDDEEGVISLGQLNGKTDSEL